MHVVEHKDNNRQKVNKHKNHSTSSGNIYFFPILCLYFKIFIKNCYKIQPV